MPRTGRRKSGEPATGAHSIYAGPDISKDAIRRGDVILDAELHAPTDRIDAVLRVLPSEENSISQWFPVRLHHAAAEVGAHVVLLGDNPIQPGASADVQLVLDRPIAAAVPDRYVIRDVSAQRTLGGGRFIDLRPSSRRRRTPERQMQRAALAIDDPPTAFAALLAVPPFASDIASFARDRALADAQTDRIVTGQGLVVLDSGSSRTAISPDRWQIFTSSVMAQLADYHAQNPDLQGVGREQLRLLLQPRLPMPVFSIALQRISREGQIVLDGGFVRLATHQVRLGPEDDDDLGHDHPATGRRGTVSPTQGARHRGGDATIRARHPAAAEAGWADGMGR